MIDHPIGWIEVSLSQVAGNSGIFTDGDWIESADQDPNGEVRLIQLADIGDGIFKNKSFRFLTMAKALELGCTFLKPGDILISRLPDPLGRCCIFPGDAKPCVTAVDVSVMRVEPQLATPKCLRNIINSPSFRACISEHSSGTTRGRISRGNLGALTLPLPPLAEQRRIVAKLDALQSRTRLAREALAAIPALLDHYRQSVLAAAFSEIEIFREIPIHQLSTLVTSGSRGWGEFYADTGPAFVRVGDLGRRRPSIGKSLARVNPPKGTEGARTSLNEGDVLVSITADLGRVGIVSKDLGDAYVSQHVGLIRPRLSDINSRYLAYALLNPVGFQKQIRETEYGATKAGLSLAQIRNALIPVPDAATQISLVKKIERQLDFVDRIESSLSDGVRTVNHLDQSLLATAFRGELVPQDPTDEPASVLLDRIRTAREMHRNDATAQRKTAKMASVASSRRRGEISPVASSSRRGEPTADPYATLLSALRQGGSLASADAQAATGLDATAVRPFLQRLVAEGQARVEGQKRGTRYVAT